MFRSTLLLLYFGSFFTLEAQTPRSAPCNYEALFQAGRRFMDASAPQYDSALLKFNSARRCNPGKGAEIDQEIQKVLDGIRLQRDEARRARAQSEKNAKALAQTLNKLEKTSAELVKLILKDAEELILNLKYAEAWKKLRYAAQTGVLIHEVELLMLEPVFWFVETGDCKQAIQMLQMLIQPDFFNRPVIQKELRSIAQLDSLQQKKHLLNCIQELDQGTFQRLQQRYFPEMVLVLGDTFHLGCDPAWSNSDCNSAPLVSLSDFTMSKSEVTYWQFGLYCAANNLPIQDHTPEWGIYGNNPVVLVNWYDAVQYTNWVNKRFSLPEKYVFENQEFIAIKTKLNESGYRLPTEAEWEFAARSGKLHSPFPYSGGDELSVDDIGWYDENSVENGTPRTHPVKLKKPNALGIYDLSGNVWEWCQDWHAPLLPGPQHNPLGPAEGESRVLKGGAFSFGAASLRVYNRNAFAPTESDKNSGFRVVKGW